MEPVTDFWRRLLYQGVIALVILLFLSLFLLSSPANISAQARPTLTPGGPIRPTLTPRSPEASGSGSPFGTGFSPCDTICGRAINLETNVGEPAQAVHFTGPANNWFVGVSTDDDGNYGFGQLGVDAGLLNLYFEDGAGYPATTDVALAPMPGWGTVVNLGLYHDRWAVPPLAPIVWANPTFAQPGDTVTFVVRVENQLEHGISGVMVTDLLPAELLLTEVTTERGGTDRRGNYGAVLVGDIAPQEVVTMHFVASVLADLGPGMIQNQVSLIYRENVAAQATAWVTVGGEPGAEADSAVESDAPIAQPSDATPALLPVTGFGLPEAGVGLSLGITALAARYTRKRDQRPSPDKKLLPSKDHVNSKR